jgi:hypothetical protein
MVMHNTDVAGFVPATIQMTPAPMMPREMRYASTVSIMASLPRRCFFSVALGAPRLLISAPGDIANVAIHVAIGNSRWPKINFVPGWIRRSLVGGSR